MTTHLIIQQKLKSMSLSGGIGLKSQEGTLRVKEKVSCCDFSPAPYYQSEQRRSSQVTTVTLVSSEREQDAASMMLWERPCMNESEALCKLVQWRE